MRDIEVKERSNKKNLGDDFKITNRYACLTIQEACEKTSRFFSELASSLQSGDGLAVVSLEFHPFDDFSEEEDSE